MKTILQKNGITTALITGASSGIGLCFAQTLASYGCRLVLVSNEAERLPIVAAQLTASYDAEVHFHYQDLARLDAPQAVFNFCVERDLQIDLLINNAGVFRFNPIIDTPAEQVEQMILLHTLTLSQLSRLFATRMLADKRSGFILNLASLAAWMPLPGIALYSATKAYVRNFSQSLHDELYDRSIRVMALCPGGVDTALYGLLPRLRRLGVRLGILTPTQRLIDKSLRALLRGKAVYVPGAINRLFIPFFGLLPCGLFRWMDRKLARFHH